MKWGNIFLGEIFQGKHVLVALNGKSDELHMYGVNWEALADSAVTTS